MLVSARWFYYSAFIVLVPTNPISYFLVQRHLTLGSSVTRVIWYFSSAIHSAQQFNFTLLYVLSFVSSVYTFCYACHLCLHSTAVKRALSFSILTSISVFGGTGFGPLSVRFLCFLFCFSFSVNLSVLSYIVGLSLFFFYGPRCYTFLLVFYIRVELSG